MKNLTDFVNAVWAAKNVDEKRLAVKNLIEASHAKKETKMKYLNSIRNLSSNKLDQFAVNFAMSGEGIKVI